MEIIKVPVESFRRIPNPLEQEGKQMYIAVVKVENVPKELQEWKKINPREATEKTGVSKIISKSLTDAPKEFFFKNRGITLLVDKVDFKTNTKDMYLELVQSDLHGILDGGHTYTVIRYLLDELDLGDGITFDEAYLRIEILSGFTDKEEAVNIVYARNKSAAVKDQGIEDLYGNFDLIKNILSSETYANRIAYKETEFDDDGSKKDIDIKDILSYLICFDIESFDNNSHPIMAYSSKAGVLNHFKNHRDKLNKYLPLLPKILELKNIIYQEMPDTWNSTGGKFGKLEGIMYLANKKRTKQIELEFIEGYSEYIIPSSFILPILASFRNLVEIKDGLCKWKTDPILMFHEMKTELVTRVIDHLKEAKSANKLGKNKHVWQSCYDKVENEVLRQVL
jgi:hypothetical protein